MKHLFFPLLACIPCANLVAKPFSSPAETEISRDRAREQIVAIYDYYRNTPSSLMFDKLETVDWDRPLIDGAAMASAGVVTLHRGHRWDLYPYTSYFSQSDVVNVKLARMDSVSYRIWRSYTEHMSLSNLMFLAPSSDLETNVQGGYGYWCGYNAVRKQIVIADSLP